jgi:hypothetical protein
MHPEKQGGRELVMAKAPANQDQQMCINEHRWNQPESVRMCEFSNPCLIPICR